MTDALVIPEVAFLRCAALYFETRPTNGEDAAHWSNVYNAENCRKAAAEIERLRAEVERLTRENADWQTMIEAHNDVMEAKLTAAEADRDRLRAALEAQEALSQKGLLNATDEEVGRVRDLRRAALSPATGEGS